MKYILVLMIVALAIAVNGCKKNKFTTEPQVTIKSISPKTVYRGDLVQVKGSFTDDEGDVDSAFIVFKWYNGAAAVLIDTFKNYTISATGIPAKTREADFTLSFGYGVLIDPFPTLPNSPVIRDTSAAFGLILKDKAGHRSNYDESEKIRLKKP